VTDYITSRSPGPREQTVTRHI